VPAVLGADVAAPQGFELTGDVTVGLTPALLSSVAPRGMPPPDTEPADAPPRDDVEAMPNAVPADVREPHDPEKPIGPELSPNDAVPEAVVLVVMPAASKVGVELVAPDVLELAMPALKQGSVLAVEASGDALRLPGEDAAPGIPSGDVVPIAGLLAVLGAIWAKPALQPKRTAAIAINRRRKDTSHFGVVLNIGK